MARRQHCRICRGQELSLVLDLGLSPLANRFLKAEQLNEEEPSFPLDVFFCRTCSLVQLLEVVDPEVLFRDYVYVSGTSETMRTHFADFADSVINRFRFEPNSLIVEVASNDGTFLSNFEGKGLRLLGVEPAVNIAAIARSRGIPTVNEFFSPEIGTAVRTEHGEAACVLATNVFAHLDDMHGFVEGVLNVIGPEGIYIFENSYVRDMVEHLEFDSVYHEHLSYFSVTALTHLFEAHGMEIFDVEHTPVHGGSLRVFVKRKGASHPVTEAPEAFRRQEREDGFCDVARYEEFGDKVYELKTKLLEMLEGMRRDGKRVVAYGSSAKGNTLLNYLGAGEELIGYVVDKNPMKQGTFSPGRHLRVLPVETLLENKPDYALILAWNFATEILGQQEEFISGGGRFIMPMPSPRIVPE
jgi:hypothetical protein